MLCMCSAEAVATELLGRHRLGMKFEFDVKDHEILYQLKSPRICPKNVQKSVQKYFRPKGLTQIFCENEN